MDGACINGVMDMIHTIDKFYAAQFASLVGKLDGFQEGTGTVLDNSATVWFRAAPCRSPSSATRRRKLRQ